MSPLEVHQNHLLPSLKFGFLFNIDEHEVQDTGNEKVVIGAQSKKGRYLIPLSHLYINYEASASRQLG